MPALLNPSFELVGGLAATATAGNSAPYVLSEGMALAVAANGDTDLTAVVTAGTFAVVVGDQDPYALAHLDTLDITLDGVLFPLVLDSADYDDITKATAVELVDVISLAIGPAVALGSGDGVLSIGTPTQGDLGSVQISGTAAPKIGLAPDLVTGVTYFADIGSATGEEIADFLAARLDPEVITMSVVLGAPSFATTAKGDDASLAFGGVLATVLGLPLGTVVGEGSPGTADGWEILSNSAVARWADFKMPAGFQALPMETFSWEWGTTLTEIGIDDLSSWGEETFEEGWPPVFQFLGPLEGALLEQFSDWVLPGFGEITNNPDFAPFGATETFDGWAAFEDTIGASEDAEFPLNVGGTTTVERFGDDVPLLDPTSTTPALFVSFFASGVPLAGTYALNVGSVTYPTVADGILTRNALADDLANKINSSADGVSALSLVGRVRLWREDKQAFTVLAEASDGAPTLELTVGPAVDAPSLAGYWTGVTD